MPKYLKGLNQALFGWAWCPPRTRLPPWQLPSCQCLTTNALRLGKRSWGLMSRTGRGVSRAVHCGRTRRPMGSEQNKPFREPGASSLIKDSGLSSTPCTPLPTPSS